MLHRERNMLWWLVFMRVFSIHTPSFHNESTPKGI
jgi:hypothetical protein